MDFIWKLVAPRGTGSLALPNGILSKDDIVIALMGVTGAGKSTFVKRVTEREDILIGHNLTSETLECRAYQFRHAGVNFSLIDTPGFNDAFLDNTTILTQLAAFIESSYRAKIKLTAIIYLHPITNPRLEGSALDNLSMFRKLCGPQFYPNIVLATTFWSQVEDSVGCFREIQLKENDNFWGSMLKRGSQMIRLPDNQSECIDLLLKLAGKDRATLQVQDELVEQNISISQTQVSKEAKNFKALEMLRDEFTKKFDRLAAGKTTELQHQQAEFQKFRTEQEELFEAKLREHTEEVEKAKKASEALLRKAEKKRKKALEEQAKLVQKQREETERLRAELERLAIKDQESRETRRRVEKEQEKRRRMAALDAKLTAQFKLITRAKNAGTVKANISRSWLNELELRRTCNICWYMNSAQLSYSCSSCDNFEICSTCFDEGQRCTIASHTAYSRRSLVGTEAGKCRRALFPVNSHYRTPCDKCRCLFLDSIYFHCCSCNADNYDLCVDCVAKGKTCLNPGHVLQVLRA